MQRNRALIFATLAFIPLLSVSSLWASPLFGPKTYIRERGGPEAFKASFQICALSGVYTLIVENSVYTRTERDGEEEGKVKGKKNEKNEKNKDEDKNKDKEKDKKEKENKKKEKKEKDKKKEREEKENKFSAAEIKINGKKIIEEDDFNKKVIRIERTILLPQGESKMEVEVEGGPGAFITVTLECASGCLEPRITYPTAGATLNQSTTLIQGNLSHVYGESGVTVNGLPALVDDQNWVYFVALQEGIHTITVIATDSCGYTATATIEISANPGSTVLRLDATPLQALAPITVMLKAQTKIANPVYRWDLDGDGKIDSEGADLSKMSTVYSQEGFYYPSVTVIDSHGQAHTETTVVQVVAREKLDVMLQSKWVGMKNTLEQGRIEQAVSFFAVDSRERYREIFNMVQAQLPEIVSGMGAIQFINLENGVAKYRIRRQESAGDITYNIYFVIDQDGIWRIKQF